MALASILFSLEWWMDPSQRDRQAEIRGQQERDEEDESGDDPPAQLVIPPPSAGRGPAAYACRVCGQRAAEKTYCLACLADTMEPAG